MRTIALVLLMAVVACPAPNVEMVNAPSRGFWLDRSMFTRDRGVDGVAALPGSAIHDLNAETPCEAAGDGVDIASWANDGSESIAPAQPTAANQPTCFGSSGSWYVHADGNDWMDVAGVTTYAAGHTICMVGGFDTAGSARNSKYITDGEVPTSRGAFIATNSARYWSYFAGTFLPETTAEASDNSYDIVCVWHDADGTTTVTVNGNSVTGNAGTSNDSLLGITLFSYHGADALFPKFRLKRWIAWDSDVRADAYAALAATYGTPTVAF